MNRLYSLLAGCALFALGGVLVQAQPVLQIRDVATGLNTPWEILWGPDGWIWMTERYGRVSRVNPETGEVKPLLTIADVQQSGESGLLGMALHPAFTDNPQVFVAYTYRGAGGEILEKMVRYRYDGTTLLDPVVLIQGIPGNTYHDGCRLMTTPDGKILMTTGDAGSAALAQNHTSVNGKLFRMNLDGSAPADNPWPGASFPANLIWSTGHRNAQGLVLASNGILYSSEHGPNNDDEINIIRKGRNYGWPNVQGFCNSASEQTFCADSNVVEPIKAWTPTIAPGGIEYYDKSAIPEWQNSLLLVNLKESDLRQFKLSADGMQILQENILYDNRWGRLRDICIAPDGRVFISTSNRDGRGTVQTGDDRIIELKSGVSGPSIGIPSVSGDVFGRFFPGMSPVVSFSPTGTGTFNANNVFTAQLSDANGAFVAPFTLLGTLAGPSGGTITGRLACDIPPGTGYRIRIVASSPNITSEGSTPFTIEPRTRAVITPSGTLAFCEGDSFSVVLRGLAGMDNRWSTGQTTDTIVVTSSMVRAGTSTFTLVVTENGCPDTSLPLRIIEHKSPVPNVVVTGRRLEAEPGYANYLWSTGDTARIMTAPSTGYYTVTVVDTNGCRGTSASYFVDVSLGVPDPFDADGLVVVADPVREQISVRLNLPAGQRLRLALVDIGGNVVMTLDETSTSEGFRRDIPMKDLPAGAYLLELRSGERSWTRKVVKP